MKTTDKEKNIITGNLVNIGICKPIGKEWVDKVKESINNK